MNSMPQTLDSVNLNVAKDMCISYMKKSLVPMVISPPGLGKSSMAQAIANKYEWLLIDIRLAQYDPSDLNGFPDIDRVEGLAKYVPFDTFPTENTVLPINPLTGRPYKGWLLFLDELTHAAPAVQKASYKLILDKMVGPKKLHHLVVMMAAGNLITDNSFVEPMAPTLQSRLTHIKVHVDHKIFLEWGYDNDLDYRINAFIHYKPANLMKYDPYHTDMTFACPRTWEFTNRMISDIPKITREHRMLIAGCISLGMAAEFVAFNQIFAEIITIEDIKRDPTGVALPTKPGVIYALTGSISENIDASNADQVMIFLSRLAGEFQMITMQSVVRRKPELMQIPSVSQWCDRFIDEVF
jgi:hypothetical protein